MQQIEFFVDNIKCGGCANTVTKKLNSYTGVADVTVNVEEGRVSFSAHDSLNVEEVQTALARLGYAPRGTSTAFQTAKSYVSCAIGRMTAEEGKA